MIKIVIMTNNMFDFSPKLEDANTVGIIIKITKLKLNINLLQRQLLNR